MMTKKQLDTLEFIRHEETEENDDYHYYTLEIPGFLELITNAVNKGEKEEYWVELWDDTVVKIFNFKLLLELIELLKKIKHESEQSQR